MAALSRNASLQLEKLVGRQSLHVTVPREVTDKDFAKIGKSIIDVIRGHTGCSCLSGVIDVIVTGDFTDAINVELG
jgi:hypothetical protein